LDKGLIEMKTKFVMAMFAVTLSVVAQASAATWPDACGKDSTQFKVKIDKKQVAPTTPEAGKALIVFTESVSGDFGSDPLARFGVDGSWVGADKGASYFAMSVAPGEHRLCAARQSRAKSDETNVGVATLTAEAGKVYYYDFNITRTPTGSPHMQGGGGLPGTPHDMTTRIPDTIDSVSFAALDENEGKHRTNVSPVSVSTAKL
jgi:hypothetical protein